MAETQGYLSRPAPSGLADVIEIILDKGVVIDAYVRVSLLGIELLTIDARIVVASVDTYLRFAEATHRLDLEAQGGPSLVDLMEEGVTTTVDKVAEQVVDRKVEAGLEKVGEVAGSVVPGAGPVAETAVRKVGEKAVAGVEKVAEKVAEVVEPDEEQ